MLLKLESWALKSRIQLKESGIHFPMISNPESREYLESGIYTMGSRIQDCLGFLYMELTEVTLSGLWTPGDVIMISYRGSFCVCKVCNQDNYKDV